MATNISPAPHEGGTSSSSFASSGSKGGASPSSSSFFTAPPKINKLQIGQKGQIFLRSSQYLIPIILGVR
jgi:hypothetical protein